MKRDLSRRELLTAGGASMIAAVPANGDEHVNSTPDFELEEATAASLQEHMRSGRYTSRRLIELYLQRIDQVDRNGPTLRSIIELNPDAPAIAARMDEERSAGRVRGPLHGVPVLIKDNIDTADRMSTTAGSLALADDRPVADAFLVERLRRAGAVLLGKTNLSEWANIRSTHSSSGWSARGGQTRNPYALDRSPSGSSSGSGAAVAANLACMAVGTETDGSVTSPSSASGQVGIKPTVGLISRAGIVPISHSQDTAGPMARTVRDAAVLLSVLAGADPRDPHNGRPARLPSDYTRFLDPAGLKGARIGLPREKFFGYHRATDKVTAAAIDVLKSHGAVLIDPADLPNAGKYDDSELEVLLYELKADLHRYLAARPRSPVKSLRDVIAYNERHADREMPFFAQELFQIAERKGPLTTRAYLQALEKNHRLSRQKGIDAVMDRYRLDALVCPTQGPVWLIDLVNGDSGGPSATQPAAVAGYPHITVPMGYVHGLPVGLSFFGRAWSEPTLLRLAYAFEQATGARKPPRFLSTAAVPR